MVIEIYAKVDTSFCFIVLSTFMINLQESLETRGSQRGRRWASTHKRQRTDTLRVQREKSKLIEKNNIAIEELKKEINEKHQKIAKDQQNLNAET